MISRSLTRGIFRAFSTKGAAAPAKQAAAAPAATGKTTEVK